MINAKQLSKGKIIKYGDQLHEVIDSQHHKPGKGGAFVKAKIRNLTTGSIITETLRKYKTKDELWNNLPDLQAI